MVYRAYGFRVAQLTINDRIYYSVIGSIEVLYTLRVDIPRKPADVAHPKLFPDLCKCVPGGGAVSFGILCFAV